MVRKAAVALALAWIASPAIADSNTTCTRSALGTFVNCTTTSQPNHNAAISDGMASLGRAIGERARRKREERNALTTPPRSVPLVDLNNGNDFLSGCASIGSEANFGLCYGFIKGFWGREYVNGPSPLICLPEAGATNKQLLDVVTKFITEHPADRHRALGLLTYAAYADAFPCPKTEPQK